MKRLGGPDTQGRSDANIWPEKLRQLPQGDEGISTCGIGVRVQGVPPEVLDRALEQFGAALLNTRSTTWRGLDAVEREREPKDLLMDHPAVMKRPLVDTGEALFLSWNKGVQDEINSML